MKKFWKWVLIIVGIFVVVFVVALIAFGIFAGRFYGGREFVMPMMRGRNWPGFNNGPLGPHMGIGRGFGIGRFGAFGLIGFGLRCLFGLGIFALVIAGIVWVVQRLTHRNQVKTVAASQAQVTPVVTPVVGTPAPVEVVTEPVHEHKCPNCGRPSQEDWKNCPYCGAPLGTA